MLQIAETVNPRDIQNMHILENSNLCNRELANIVDERVEFSSLHKSDSRHPNQGHHST